MTGSEITNHVLGVVGEVHALGDEGEGGGGLGQDHGSFHADEMDLDGGADDADMDDVIEIDAGGLALVGGQDVKAHGATMAQRAAVDNGGRDFSFGGGRSCG